MISLLWWFVKDEFARRELLHESRISRIQEEHLLELDAFKTLVNSYEQTIEKQTKELEEREIEVKNLNAVIAYAKDLHEQMFGIIKSFAPRQSPESSTQVGGVKSWPTVQKELEKRSAKEK